MTPILGLESATSDVGQMELLNRYSAAIDYLSSSSSNIITGVYNRIYVHSGFSIRSCFTKMLLDGFGAGVQRFDTPKEAADEINNDVANVTRNRIPKLVTVDAVRNSPLVLVSALYFKADWSLPFPEKDTRKAPFLTADAGDVPRELEVDMMSQKAMHMPYKKFDDFDALSVPYADPDYSMVLLRPVERSIDAVNVLRNKLHTLNIADILKQLRRTRVLLKMPKFRIEAEYALPDQLRQLGITKIFQSDADLSGISDGPLTIDKVIHKVFMEVTEKGTEAAGAGAVVTATFLSVSRPIYFILDRPFFAVVYNRRHQINLFTAFVAAPKTGPPSAVPADLNMPLMKQVVQNSAENQAISPFVMSSLMTQVWLGARGDTKDQVNSPSYRYGWSFFRKVGGA